MLTKLQLEDMWENQPYGAFSRWKEQNRKLLKQVASGAPLKNYTYEVLVYERKLVRKDRYAFKATSFEAAQKSINREKYHAQSLAGFTNSRDCMYSVQGAIISQGERVVQQ